ncbi:MAG: MDR family oxidoreductase [Elainellaceae cyanobacterium]
MNELKQTFRALVLREERVAPSVETLSLADLPPGNVLIEVNYSSLNYKDALAVTHTAPVVRSFPMVPGVDLMGTVLESDAPDVQTGDQVVLTGWGVGERYWGGYSQLARVNADWLIPLPAGLTGIQSMAIGTAGLTAMLCVMALETRMVLENQQTDAPKGSVLVTGAAGGVGSFAIALLSQLGYQVTASSGRHAALGDYLQSLGATQVIGRLEPFAQSLGKPQWDSAIDTVGGQTLATLLKMIAYNGSVSACGLSGGSDLPATVYPFILRGISLLGIDSVMCAKPKRLEAWNRLALLLSEQTLDLILEQTIPLETIPLLSQQILNGDVRGRVVVGL